MTNVGAFIIRIPSREKFDFTWETDHGVDAFHDPRYILLDCQINQ